MKFIQLSQDKFAKVSDCDYSKLGKFNWFYHKKPSDKTGYAVRWMRGRPRIILRMHWVVLGKGCDHRNGDGTDNRRCNLRKATPTQQVYNRPKSKNNKIGGFKGVSFVRDKHGKVAYCIARITVAGKRIYLGTFSDRESAAKAYDKAARTFHKSFANTNFK